MLPLAIFLVIGVLAQQTFADEPEAIVGGQPASLGEFPWQVSLRVNGQHICGGSIISPTKILTACHCVHGIVRAPWSNIKIITGTIVASRGQSHNVKSVVEHPNYVDSVRASWRNDVAVITLTAPIQYNQYQSAIPLATSPPTDGMACTLSGWGMTRANGPTSPNLLKMNQAVVPKRQCQNTHSNMPMDDSHLCTMNRRGIGACQGDSGGPLVCQGKQYGITSWVLPCAEGVPDVYCNVYHVHNFIQKCMAQP